MLKIMLSHRRLYISTCILIYRCTHTSMHIYIIFMRFYNLYVSQRVYHNNNRYYVMNKLWNGSQSGNTVKSTDVHRCPRAQSCTGAVQGNLPQCEYALSLPCNTADLSLTHIEKSLLSLVVSDWGGLWALWSPSWVPILNFGNKNLWILLAF